MIDARWLMQVCRVICVLLLCHALALVLDGQMDLRLAGLSSPEAPPGAFVRVDAPPGEAILSALAELVGRAYPPLRDDLRASGLAQIREGLVLGGLALVGFACLTYRLSRRKTLSR
jgi:hypothetical protein